MREGEIIDGKYRVGRKLGQGGMGVVVAARHIQLGEKVAIKILNPRMIADEAILTRFLREARAAARIKSEYIARVFDIGTLQNGAPYMVMEYLEGGDLTAWIAKKSPVPIAQVVDFVLQACVGLAEAHMLGIVHRDLKPSNLFCVQRADGQVAIKVLDFGISKAGDDSAGDVRLTQTATVMGSPLYMAPEQMRSARDVTAQADIWALGIVLYELLTGKTPFSGETMMEIAMNVATKPPAPLAPLRPDAPPGLEAVVFKCLEKNAPARYASVGELAVALAPYAPERARMLVERITGMSGGAFVPSTPTPASGRAQSSPLPVAPPIFYPPQFMPPMTRVDGGRRRSGAADFWVRLLAFLVMLGIGYVLFKMVGNVLKQLPGFN